MKSVKTSREKWIDILVFLCLFAAASYVTMLLFHRQTLGNEGLYHSDMKAYILEMQGLDSGYSFPYPVFFKLSALLHLFVGPELAVALATYLLNGLAIVLTKYFLNEYVFENVTGLSENKRVLARVLISVVSVGLFFVSMLYPPEGIYLPGINHKYLGVFSANPFHNATYMAARPFSILAFLWYVKLLDRYEKPLEGEGWNRYKDYVWFSLFLLVATMTKPSFTLVLVGTAGLIMLWRMFACKFANFVPTVRLGICFIPTFIDLLYQYSGVFVPSEGDVGGVGFCLGTIWIQYAPNIPLAICLGVGFPLAVLVLNWKELKCNTLFRFAWQFYLMSFAMAFFLYEKGFRANHFNFSWGYMCGIFFAFFASAAVLLTVTFQKKKPLLLALQWLPFMWHLVCGLYYFKHLFAGHMYY